MTDEQAIRWAAELCGWDVGPNGVAVSRGNHRITDCYMRDGAGPCAALDALALQLWRKWRYEFAERDSWQIVSGLKPKWRIIWDALQQDDSLQAITLMVADMEVG